ncbi:MAG TPA: hypothetical protein VF092_10545 [Longimicrobium sp.]
MADTELPAGLSGTVLATSQTSDVSGEGRAAGLAFGELIKKTGEAVAQTQKLLNKTSAASATALAETLVDVVAVEEKTYNDSGVLTTSKAHSLQLPLVNFIDPTFYRWSQVRLQGEFIAREFVSESTSSTDTSQTRSNVGIKLGGLFGIGFATGSGNFSASGTSTSTKTEASEDLSYGRVRANAQLTPRPDVTVPRPNQVIQGPRLSIIPGEIKDLKDAGGKLVGRTLSVLLGYHRMTGEAIAGKTLAIDSEGVSWSYSDPAKKTTDANGLVEITLRREFVPDAEGNPGDTRAKDFVVTARIGIIQNSTTVTF